MESITDLVGDGMGNLIGSALTAPLLFLLHDFTDDFLGVLLSFLSIPDAGLQDWLKCLLQSLLDGWGELSSTFIRLHVLWLRSAGTLTLLGSWIVVEWVLSISAGILVLLVLVPVLVVLLVLGLTILLLRVATWVIGEVGLIGQALTFLFLHLALDLTVNLALAAVVLVLALESVAGNKSGS